MAEKKRTRYFQWIGVPEDKEKISVLDSIVQEDGIYFYEFTDGERCNAEFIAPMTLNPATLNNKIMVEIPNGHSPWTFETITGKKYHEEDSDKWYDVPPLEDIVAGGKTGDVVEHSVLNAKKLIPPKYYGECADLPDPVNSEYSVKSKEEYDEPIARPSIVQTERKMEAYTETHKEVLSSSPFDTATDALLSASPKTIIKVEIPVEVVGKDIISIIENTFNRKDYALSKMASSAISKDVLDLIKSAINNFFTDK